MGSPTQADQIITAEADGLLRETSEVPVLMVLPFGSRAEGACPPRQRPGPRGRSMQLVVGRGFLGKRDPATSSPAPGLRSAATPAGRRAPSSWSRATARRCKRGPVAPCACARGPSPQVTLRS